MKILLFAEKYPGPNSEYNNDFVHQRSLMYIKQGHSVHVILKNTFENYNIDEVQVYGVNHFENLDLILKHIEPDSIGIHFFNSSFLDLILNFKGPVVIWVHGHEALHWWRRIYDYKFSKIIKHLPGLIKQVVLRLILWHKVAYISKKKDSFHLIFVSNWMLKIAEKDHLVTFNNKQIVPNPINLDRFIFQQKIKKDRLNILSIRPFTSKKYANDVTMNTILELSKRSFFDNLNFTIYGDGPDFEKFTKPLLKFTNVQIHNHFLKNETIPEIHSKHGIFLCPTRQDAQGVSMCEAMASGLVPITSNNTAIPEFVDHFETGILNENSGKAFADSIEYIFEHPEEFLRISEAASLSIRKKCNPEKISEIELQLLSEK